MDENTEIKQDLLLEMENDPFYKELIASVPKEDRGELVTAIEKMTQDFNDICHAFDELLSTGKGQHDFLNSVGAAINRRDFYGNNGVTEIPWPEKN